MVAIVQADADDLADAAQGRAERDALAYCAQRFCRDRGDGLDVVERRRARVERGKTARQVEDLTVQDEAGLFAGCRAVTHQFHGLYNNRTTCKTASQYLNPEERRV